MAGTLIDLLHSVSHLEDCGYTFLDDDLRPTQWSFAALVREARRRAQLLLASGLKPGDRIALIIPENEDFVLSFFGAVWAGLVPVPMYPPLALAKLDGYVDNAARILQAAGVRSVLTTKRVSSVLWSLVSRVRGLESLMLAETLRSGAAAPDDRVVAPTDVVPTVSPDDICFLQFTSGSTSDPKGVIVTHANLVANAECIVFHGVCGAGDRGDRGVSWLPLYHDMGLIGFVIAPLRTAIPVVFIPTLTFVKRPTVWMQTVHDYRGTITFAPNFAFGLAARRGHPASKAPLDLSCLRVVGCGAEPINRATIDHFVRVFEPMGLNPHAVIPCYGMAEATLAVSFDGLDRRFLSLRIDRNAYEESHVARQLEGGAAEATDMLELVGCGRVLPGHELRIIDDFGRPLVDGRVGEVTFRGPSVTPGYFNNAEATRAALHQDGWLRTGDLGFIVDGELYISGRKKDLIILNGRNYYPQAIEWEVEHVPEVRRGSVVAFAIQGASSEELVIVAESKTSDRAQVAQGIRKRVRDALGLSVAHIEVVAAGALPKTSSGKLQRRKTKMLYEAGQVEAGSAGRGLGKAAARITVARYVALSTLARLRHRLGAMLPSLGRTPQETVDTVTDSA